MHFHFQTDGHFAQGGVPRHVHVPAAHEQRRESEEERDRLSAVGILGGLVGRVLLGLEHAEVDQQPQSAAAFQASC